ncbi:N-acetylneuraminate synthase [Paenibacillus campi]|uniref:N-acetylneuraminate synthase n=1 Tax=Paenibacillus campi TaxID=3106031 RepID=UPI002AFF55FF|nr:N-acetylneuraminate synthase [Paenibacillus sp. SGZ-1014]
MSVYIIAEAGVNHNGDLSLAKQLIDIAREAGADAVKFQTFISENEISVYADMADYQQKNMNDNSSQLEMVKKLELAFDDFVELKHYCELQNIEFLSTPFDFDSADFLLNKLNLESIKIPSGEITNAPFLLYIARHKRKMIVSTGMATLSDIQQALGVIAFGLLDIEPTQHPSVTYFEQAYMSQQGQQLLKEYVTLLHCTTEYPAPIDAVNLNAIPNMSKTFDLPVGYSDHTDSIAVPTAAVALGATIIEKHITFDKKAVGPDHAASIEPDELKSMVTFIRQTEQALGNGVKIPSPVELKNRAIARKSLVASKKIRKGEAFSIDNLAIKRPGTGISPMMYWEIQNFRAPRDFEYDEEINLYDCNARTSDQNL